MTVKYFSYYGCKRRNQKKDTDEETNERTDERNEWQSHFLSCSSQLKRLSIFRMRLFLFSMFLMILHFENNAEINLLYILFPSSLFKTQTNIGWTGLNLAQLEIQFSCWYWKYNITSISGPTGPEMLAFWQAFQKLRTDGQTEQRFMYVDELVY